MKYLLILIIMLTATTTCFGQERYSFSGSFSPQESSFSRVPVDTEIQLSTIFSWQGTSYVAGDPPPYISVYFSFDTSIITLIGPPPEANGEYGSVNLEFLVKSNTPQCFTAPYSAGFSAYFNLSFPDSLIPFPDGWYFLQGVIYDPKIIGKVSAPDSSDFGSVRIDSLAIASIPFTDDSLGQHHQIKVLSIDEPFGFDDTIEVLYPCEDPYNSPNRSYFHPTKPGHYVDTAKFLDSLTNDTISVVLIGDAYDAGVSSVPETPVKLFPNPCDREFQIDIPSEESAQIEIYNLFGERGYSFNTQGSDATIDCSHFPAGVYFVSIDGMTSHLTQKLIVAH